MVIVLAAVLVENKTKMAKKTTNSIYETIIIGAGISGLTAAMYAARKKMKYEIISSDFGGQFMVSGEVLNYPGIVKTTGVEFSSIMEEQMKFNQVKIVSETVKQIKKVKDGFKVTTNIHENRKFSGHKKSNRFLSEKEYSTKTVLITTGSKPRMLKVPGEKKFSKMGVTYCSICDGPLFSGKEVVIVGGGSSALEAVDFMKDIAKKITMFVRGDKFTGHEYLIEKVKKNKKVKVFYNAETTEILGDKFVNGIKFKQNDKEQTLKVEGVIIEIGRLPNTEFVSKLLKLDKHNHIEIDCHGNTSVPGIFSAGDCASGHEYQYVISAGQGCMALLKIARYLANKK